MTRIGMLLGFARILEEIGTEEEKEEIDDLKTNATRIIEDCIKYQFVSDVEDSKDNGGGFFRVLNASKEEFGNVGPVEVRALSDIIYTGQAIGLIGNHIDLLPASVREKMVDFTTRELLGNGWMKAISPLDDSMKNINCDSNSECDILDLLSMRADWTATGAYGGLPGAAVESICDLEQGFASALSLLTNFSIVTDESLGTMPGQGIAVFTPPYIVGFLDDNAGIDLPTAAYAPSFPEFFDDVEHSEGFPDCFPTMNEEDGPRSCWPNTSRSIQNAEGSISDAFINAIHIVNVCLFQIYSKSILQFTYHPSRS